MIGCHRFGMERQAVFDPLASFVCEVTPGVVVTLHFLGVVCGGWQRQSLHFTIASAVL